MLPSPPTYWARSPKQIQFIGSICMQRVYLTFCCISPDVEFCGYSIPHPSEELMNIRIQTYG